MMKGLAVLLVLAASQGDEEARRLRGLIRNLGADFLEERLSARQALEEKGPAAEPYLVDALGSPDFRIRKTALHLLSKLKTVKARPRAAALFSADEDLSVRDAAFAFLKELGKEAEDDLIVALGSTRRRYRLGSVKALTALGSRKAADPVAHLFEQEKDAEIKDAAFQCMTSLGEAARPFLLKHLVDADPKVRLACLEGLEASKGDDVLQAVGKLFAAESDATVIGKAHAYLEKAGPKGEPFFLAGLKSVQEDVRLRSISGLKTLKTERAIDAVGLLFENDRLETIRKKAAEFLVTFGLKSEAVLIRALDAKDPETRLTAILSLGEIKSEKPLDRIARLFREDKDKRVHEKSFAYLKQLGKKAEDHLLFALDDPNKTIRREAIRSLGTARSEKAVPRLLDFMTQLDPNLRAEARDALVRVGAPAIEAVNEAAARGSLKKSDAREVLALYYQEEVERLLDAMVTDKGGTGTYAGQFRPLEEFGTKKALPVLLKIAGDSMPAFRVRRKGNLPQDYEKRMREMAITALGALGEREALAPLQEVLSSLPSKPVPGRLNTVQDELVLALYRLGDKKPLRAYLAAVQENAEKALEADKLEDACGELFYVGLLYNRIGERDKSRAAYLRLVKAVEDRDRAAEEKLTAQEKREANLHSAYYNLACLSSLAGAKAEAVSWLEKSVRTGFKDRQWIRIDGDLENIREEEGYRKLMADDALFEGSP